METNLWVSLVLLGTGAVLVAAIWYGRRPIASAPDEMAQLVRRTLFDLSEDPVVVLDTEGRLVERNAAAATLVASAVGPTANPTPPPAAGGDLAAIARAAQTKAEIQHWPLDVEGRRYDARPIPLRGSDGRSIGVVVHLRDVTEEVQTEARLRARAATDHVTGVFDPMHIMDQVRRELIRASRYGCAVTLMIVDLDGFDEVTRAHGEEGGEALLRAVAATIVTDLRAADSVGRTGPATFTVCLPEADEAEALAVARRLRREIAAIEVPFGGAVVRATASIGTRSASEIGTYDFDALLTGAEVDLLRDRDRLRRAAAPESDDVVLCTDAAASATN